MHHCITGRVDGTCSCQLGIGVDVLLICQHWTGSVFIDRGSIEALSPLLAPPEPTSLGLGRSCAGLVVG